MTVPADPLQRGLGTALWRQVEMRLVEEIGRLAPDSRLPPEGALATRFGVNRHTVRQALRALVGRGLVRVEQGKGAFVREPIDYRLGASTRFTANLLAAERLARHELIELRDARADGPLAETLQVAAGAPLLAVRSLGLADGVPIVIGAGWLVTALLPDARRRLTANPSYTALFAAHGHADYRRGETRIGARPALDDEARLLRMAAAAPVMVTESTDLTVAGIPLAAGRSVWASERVQFVVGG